MTERQMKILRLVAEIEGEEWILAEFRGDFSRPPLSKITKLYIKDIEWKGGGSEI